MYEADMYVMINDGKGSPFGFVKRVFLPIPPFPQLCITLWVGTGSVEFTIEKIIWKEHESKDNPRSDRLTVWLHNPTGYSSHKNRQELISRLQKDSDWGEV